MNTDFSIILYTDECHAIVEEPERMSKVDSNIYTGMSTCQHGGDVEKLRSCFIHIKMLLIHNKARRVQRKRLNKKTK